MQWDENLAPDGPAASAAESSAIAPARRLAPSRTEPILRVLVVDDHPVHRKIAHTIFDALGCAVALADSGKAGLAAALAQPFDLIVLDRHMPGGGDRTVRQLRVREGPSRNAYVVCCSSDPPVDVTIGYDGTACKPLTVELAVALLAIARLRQAFRVLRDAAPAAKGGCAKVG